MNNKLVIRLLGHVAIEIDGRPLSGLPSRAAEALLIYLVCHNRPIPRETLADLLWGERTQKQGLTNLRTILTGLRRELDEYLVVTRQTLAFNHAASYWLDVAEFENQLNRLQPQLPVSAPLSPEMAHTLQTTLDLYQDNFLATFSLREGREFEAWALLRREQLKRLVSLGLHGLVMHNQATGNYLQGLHNAEKLLNLDPYDEAAQQQSMWLLVRCGQPNAALQQYRKFSQLLADELGLEPAPKTNRLYQRLKTARAFSRDNLPPESTLFVGRETELHHIRTYLANQNCRLLSLVGPGGIGKTRLALEAARRQQSGLLHGVCFVPLAGLPSADPLALVLAIAEALQLSLPGAGDPQAQLFKALHERETLLVLDNFEHLLGPTTSSPETEIIKKTKYEQRLAAEVPPKQMDAPAQGEPDNILAVLSGILASASEVKILVTSRERLNLEEEWLFQVDGLPVPDEKGAAQEIAGNSAVLLFWQSAGRVQTGFAPAESEWADIGRICRLVEGMPLAIKLASAWVRVMPCRQIALEIESSLAILHSSARNAPPRQRSIETVFDHSWQLLAAEEQHILARLSVFRGGFNRETAHYVADAAPPVLAKLVDKSWLTLNIQGRYEWHDLLRRYAAEKLGQAKPGQMTAARYAEFYAAFLKDRQVSLGNEKQVEVLTEVSTELENIRAVWQWAVVQNRFDLIRWSLESLWNFYEIKSWFYEGEEIFRQAANALVQPGAAEPDDHTETQQQLLAQLLIRQGWFCMRLARLDQAQLLLERGLSLVRHIQDYQETGRALHHLGITLMLSGQYPTAKQMLEESLAIYRQHNGSHFDLGSALGTLGIILIRMGQFDQAQPVIEEGLFYYRQSGNPRAIALIYSFLGGFSIQAGGYRQAITLLHEGLTFQKMIDDWVMTRMSLAWLGEAHEMLGEYSEARQFYEESLLISRGNGDQEGVSIALNNLGRVNVPLGEYHQARSYLREGLIIALDIRFRPLIINGLIGVSTLLAQMGAKQHALDILIPTLNHPAAEPQMRARAGQLLARLSDVPPEILAKTETEETLEAVVARLLEEDSLWNVETSSRISKA